MSYTIEQIKEKEEMMYYPLIKTALDMSPLYPVFEDEEKRLADELEIIHKMKQSKVIWYCFLIASEAKKNNEPYFVRGTMPDLFILYALGITKSNPVEIGCCYQACLGTKENPKPTIYFDISFRPEYVGKIKQYAKTIESNIKVFHYSYHIDETPVQYSPSSIIAIPEYVDESKFCIIKDSRDDLKVLGMKDLYSFDIGVKFNLLSAPMLGIVKSLQRDFEIVDFDKAFDDFKYVVFDDQFSSEHYRKVAERINIVMFSNALNLEGYAHASHKKNDVCSFIFPDRESVFYYFSINLKMPESIAYFLMEEVRTGAFGKKEHSEDEFNGVIDKDEFYDLSNILYLFPRGHSAEYLYWRFQEAHYFRYHKEEYLKLKEEYNKED